MYVSGRGKQFHLQDGVSLWACSQRRSVISRFIRLLWTRHILFPVFSSVHFNSLVFSLFLSCSSFPSYATLSPPPLSSLPLLFYSLLSSPRTWVENKWDTCHSKKASGGERELLRHCVSLLFVLPEWYFSESVVLSLSPRSTVTTLWAKGSTGSISTQLSAALSELVYSFYCRHRWDSHGGTDRHAYI